MIRGVLSRYTEITNIPDLTSDHSPVLLSLSSTLQQKARPTKLASKHTDWDLFRDVTQHINLRTSLKTVDELDIAATTFTFVVQDAAKAATPEPPKTHQTSYYPSEGLKLVRERRKMRHLY